MFHAANGFFEEFLIDLCKLNFLKEKQDYEKANYEHPAHPVHGIDPAADDGICYRVDNK